LIKQFRIDHRDHFRLASVDPTDTGGLDLDKDAANETLARDSERLAQPGSAVFVRAARMRGCPSG
jgi:hypothetical protein